MGIDAVAENISTAEYHADPSLKENLRYQHGRNIIQRWILSFIHAFLFVSIVTLEELCENVEQLEKYDAIIASEVLEHVNNVDSFIVNLSKLLKVKISS